MTAIALLSDPHLHDVSFGETDTDAETQPGFVRSLAASMQSTRVFNESEAALRSTLDAVVAEGITLCIIAGDLTDDGQPANWQAVSDLLGHYTRQHGLRFFATPGNHDQWSLTGKPLAKEFVSPDGQVETRAGLSVPPHHDARACAGMRMVGYDEAMLYAGQFGYLPQATDLHWETPFGTDSDMASREAPVGSRRGDNAYVVDLSYLVEPVKDLWLLSIDANIYLPDGSGGFADGSKDGWNATVRHKPHLLPWMRDVARRAEAADKRLIAFSHYPMTDVFQGCTEVLETLLASPAGARRMPAPDVSAALAETGIGLHFSGHWHVAATAASENNRLVNVALPSTVAFPAGWLRLDLDAGGPHLADRPLSDAPGFDRWFPRYAAECTRTGQNHPALKANGYAAYLDSHFRDVVLDRRLAEDWPHLMQPMFREARLPEIVARLDPTDTHVPDIAFAEVLVDWYRLRESGGGAGATSPERRTAYAALARRYGDKAFPPGSEAACIAIFLKTLGLLLVGEAKKRDALARLKVASLAS